MENTVAKQQQPQQHFVLVHGAALGGWCWYKVATLLAAAGHKVTAPDLAASGKDPRSLREVGSFREYVRPLMELVSALPDGERVVLVGHSYGGQCIALAMDRFPAKVAAAVFLSAFMPDTRSSPSAVLDEYVKRYPLPWMDTQVLLLDRIRGADNSCKPPLPSLLLGPSFASSRVYQLSPPEDITLGLSLMRPASMFLDDLSEEPPLKEEAYGSVRTVFVVCEQDLVIPKQFQLWMTERHAVDAVKVIGAADHMPMTSTPRELCDLLLRVTDLHSA